MTKHNKLKQTDFFLPDFCAAQSVFLVVLIAELLALIFTLLNSGSQTSLWNALGLYSLSIQSVTLVSIACLCLLRGWLANYNDWICGLISLVVILLATTLYSLVTIKWYWLMSIDLGVGVQANFLIRNLTIGGIIGAVALRYFYLQQQYRKQLALKSSARLEALQARIRPHFLFNSMNVIASLTRIDPKKAETAIEDLSDLFRATLDNRDELIPFSQELENAQRYLAIEKLRLGERLEVETAIDPLTLKALVPPLSVQPLLENAVYHGIQSLPEGGCIRLEASVDDTGMTIRINNPKAYGEHHRGTGMALSNIRQRLAMIYSDRAKLLCEETSAEYRVTLYFPLHKRDD